MKNQQGNDDFNVFWTCRKLVTCSETVSFLHVLNIRTRSSFPSS